MNTNECHRCQGRGYLNAFTHVQNGTCFTCLGTGLAERPKIKLDLAPQAIATPTNDLTKNRRIVITREEWDNTNTEKFLTDRDYPTTSRVRPSVGKDKVIVYITLP